MAPLFNAGPVISAATPAVTSAVEDEGRTRQLFTQLASRTVQIIGEVLDSVDTGIKPAKAKDKQLRWLSR